MMISAPTNQPGQLNRVYYKQALRQVRDVAGSFKPIDADTTSKGDREMSVCEMQRQYERANDAVQRAQYDSLVAAWRIRDVQGRHVPPPKPPTPKKAGGIGAVYCAMITRYFHMNELHAAERPRQDTTTRGPVKAAQPAKAGNRGDCRQPEPGERETPGETGEHPSSRQSRSVRQWLGFTGPRSPARPRAPASCAFRRRRRRSRPRPG